MSQTSAIGGSAAPATYPASADPLLAAAWAHFALDRQIAGQLQRLSDRIDSLRQQLQLRQSTLDAFGRAVGEAPAGAARVDFLAVGASERDRIVADLTELGLTGQVSVVPSTSPPGFFTFRVDRASIPSVGDTLSQGVQALMTTSQTEQLALQNEVARYSTLSQTVAALQSSYVAVARTAIQAIGG